MIRRPPRSPLFPSTPLFRSRQQLRRQRRRLHAVVLEPERRLQGRARLDRERTRLKSSNVGLFRIASFFLNDPATPEISPLPLHAALPISTTTATATPTASRSRART